VRVTELISVPASGRDDPKGERLAAVLNAQRRAEDWSTRRLRSARFVIVMSFPMAYLMLSQLGRVPEGRMTFTFWLVGVLMVGGSLAAELRARRQVDRLLRRAGGRRISVGQGSDARVS
jgi:hypothetical protein